MMSLLISVLNDTVTVDVDFIFQYFIHYKIEVLPATDFVAKQITPELVSEIFDDDRIEQNREFIIAKLIQILKSNNVSEVEHMILEKYEEEVIAMEVAFDATVDVESLRSEMFLGIFDYLKDDRTYSENETKRQLKDMLLKKLVEKRNKVQNEIAMLQDELKLIDEKIEEYRSEMS